MAAGRLVTPDADRRLGLGHARDLPAGRRRGTIRRRTGCAVRQQARAATEAGDNIRVKAVAKGGKVLGGEVGQMLAGRLGINVKISGTVHGRVVGLTMDRKGGGLANVNVEVDTVGEDGALTRVTIDNFGGQPSHSSCG